MWYANKNVGNSCTKKHRGKLVLSGQGGTDGTSRHVTVPKSTKAIRNLIFNPNPLGSPLMFL